MLSLLISLLVLCLILGVVYWILSMIPIPPPFAWVVRVVFAIICLICLISILTGYWSFPIHMRY